MADQIINNLLNSKTSIDDILKWLTKDDNDDQDIKSLDDLCTKAEFALYFLEFLKNQFNSLPNTTNKKLPDELKILCKTENSIKNILKNEERSEIKSTSLSIQSTPKNRGKITPNFQLDCSDASDLSKSNSNIKTSTPISKRIKPVSCSSTSVEINPIFSPQEIIKDNESFDSIYNRSFDNSHNSIEIAGTHKQHSFTNIFKISNDTSSSDLSSNNTVNSRSCNSNSMINNEVKNSKAKQSPTWLNKTLPTSDITTQQKYKNTPPSVNSKKNKPNKTVKPMRRQTFSLGDFISTHTWSDMKNSDNKNETNKQSAQKLFNKQQPSNTLVVTDETFPQIDSNPRRRKKLEISYKKDTKECSPIRIVSKYSIPNIQALDMSPAKKLTNVEECSVIQNIPKSTMSNTSLDMPSISEGINNEQYSPLRISNKSTMLNSSLDISPIRKKLSNLELESESYIHQTENIQKINKNSNKNINYEQIIQQSSTPNENNQSNIQIIPSLELVDKIEILDKLIKVYSVIWDCNMIINPVSELYFVIYLITLQYTQRSNLNNNNKETITSKTAKNKEILKNITPMDNSLNYDVDSEDLSLKSFKEELGCANLINDDSYSDGKESVIEIKLDDTEEQIKLQNIDELNETLEVNEVTTEIGELFDSPHNCVYFACCVLDNQKELLSTLDEATLKLLAKNDRITAFNPSLCQYLTEKYNFKLNIAQKEKKTYKAKLDESNVCFQADTDNAEHFSSRIAFAVFRQQRDMFYEIFHEWEKTHDKANKKSCIQFETKIQKMLHLHKDVSNYYHFVRLFKSQLLSSCLNNDHEGEDLSVLETVKNVNIERLTQLKERFVKPLKSNGPVPIPTFYGKQEFFQDFVIAANDHVFYHHLQNCLVYEILELNDTQLVYNEMENEEEAIDDYKKQLFVKTVSSLRLLAKMLGFLLSLPYNSITNVSGVVLASQLSLRSNVSPPLNIQDCLHKSMKQGRLSLTLPWIVEYLSMLDEVTLRLPYYVKILEFLYDIYRASENLHFKNTNFMSQQTAVLVKFSLGWLFELPNFPKYLYYTWQSNYSRQKLKNFCHLKEDQTLQIEPEHENESKVNLDKLDIIDDATLYLCCPFLSELRILLLTGNYCNFSTFRRLAPSELKNDPKQLQMQLEQAFFTCQPTCRKIVDFVSERVSSSIIKYICYVILPQEKIAMMQEINDAVINVETSSNMTAIMNGISNLSKSYSIKIKMISQDIAYKMCDNRIKKCIEALLPEDSLQQVKDTCVSIATRNTLERVKKWLLMHCEEDKLFVEDINTEKNKLTNIIKIEKTKREKSMLHDSEAASPTLTLSLLRECLISMLEGRGESLTLEIITDILQGTKDSLIKRKDLLPIPEKILFSLTIDFALCLLTYRPDLMTSDFQNKFVDLWKSTDLVLLQNDSPMTRILAPRNILILEKSTQSLTWTTLARFIQKLLENDILTFDNLSDQCVAVFRDEWQMTTLQNLSKFLTDVISNIKLSKKQEDTERIRTLLEWVAAAYNDIDNLY